MCWFGLAGLVSDIAGLRAGHRWPVPAQAAAVLYPGSGNLCVEGTASPYLVPGETCKETYATAEICILLLCLQTHTHACSPRMSVLLHSRTQPTRAGLLGWKASSFSKRRAVKAKRGMTGTEGGSAGELCMTQGGEPLSARTKACARQPGSLLYLYLPFAGALSPLPACNSAQISEEAGRLIFSVCMAKERGRALTPDSQLLNPPLRPAEGKGKNLSALASCWCGEGCSDLAAVLSLGLHAGPPQTGRGLSQQGSVCLMCVRFLGGL